MFRRNISATEHTDVDAEVAALKSACVDARLTPQLCDLVASEVGAVLRQLVDRGKQLAAMGSQMNVTKEVTGTGYSIKLSFSANERPSFLQRVLATIRGR